MTQKQRQSLFNNRTSSVCVATASGFGVDDSGEAVLSVRRLVGWIHSAMVHARVKKSSRGGMEGQLRGGATTTTSHSKCRDYYRRIPASRFGDRDGRSVGLRRHRSRLLLIFYSPSNHKASRNTVKINPYRTWYSFSSTAT